ncbi:hypothetical protein CKO51_02855 [Rhodopirellula sp. SM50]|nr:hypothetical protein [Rhodopirellula sp. SM50]PAY21004.1 hypothetical protein CKO51_02855 [Rhodopirellula sp. SM50]
MLESVETTDIDLIENKSSSPFLCQTTNNAMEEIKTQKEVSDKLQGEAIKMLEFLVGSWKSIDPENAPPAPETRTISRQPDGLSLTVSIKSVLGKGPPIHIVYDLQSHGYLLTHTDSTGDKRVFRAKLIDGNRLEIPIEGKKTLFAGMTFIVTVSDDSWTESIEWPGWKDPTVYQRSFVRQRPQE